MTATVGNLKYVDGEMNVVIGFGISRCVEREDGVEVIETSWVRPRVNTWVVDPLNNDTSPLFVTQHPLFYNFKHWYLLQPCNSRLASSPEILIITWQNDLGPPLSCQRRAYYSNNCTVSLFSSYGTIHSHSIWTHFPINYYPYTPSSMPPFLPVIVKIS